MLPFFYEGAGLVVDLILILVAQFENFTGSC